MKIILLFVSISFSFLVGMENIEQYNIVHRPERRLFEFFITQRQSRIAHIKYSDNSFFYEPIYKNYLEIEELRVEEEYQRKGIGTKLLQKVIALAESKHCSHLTVTSENNVMAFYKKNNFKEVSAYYPFTVLEVSLKKNETDH